jgi:hypothetical protein
VVRRSRPPRGGDVGDEEGDGGGRVPRKNGSGCWRGEGRMRDWSGRTGRGGGADARTTGETTYQVFLVSFFFLGVEIIRRLRQMLK